MVLEQQTVFHKKTKNLQIFAPGEKTSAFPNFHLYFHLHIYTHTRTLKHKTHTHTHTLLTHTHTHRVKIHVRHTYTKLVHMVQNSMKPLKLESTRMTTYKSGIKCVVLESSKLCVSVSVSKDLINGWNDHNTIFKEVQ